MFEIKFLKVFCFPICSVVEIFQTVDERNFKTYIQK